jgi:hypothetical protein
LKWFDKLNPIRNKAYHGRKVTEEDHIFLTQLNDWLPARIGIEKVNISL